MVADRLAAPIDPSFKALKESIQASGQQVPILVRPSLSSTGPLSDRLRTSAPSRVCGAGAQGQGGDPPAQRRTNSSSLKARKICSAAICRSSNARCSRAGSKTADSNAQRHHDGPRDRQSRSLPLHRSGAADSRTDCPSDRSGRQGGQGHGGWRSPNFSSSPRRNGYWRARSRRRPSGISRATSGSQNSTRSSLSRQRNTEPRCARGKPARGQESGKHRAALGSDGRDDRREGGAGVWTVSRCPTRRSLRAISQRASEGGQSQLI